MEIDSRGTTSDVGTKVEEASSNRPLQEKQTNFDAKENVAKV